MSTDTFDTRELIEKQKALRAHFTSFKSQFIKTSQEAAQALSDEAVTTAVTNHQFTSDVIDALPSRFKDLFMGEFATWLMDRGRETHPYPTTLEGEYYDIGVAHCHDFVTYELSSSGTGVSVVETITYDSLAPFLQAGLNWHPQAKNFFVPRA